MRQNFERIFKFTAIAGLSLAVLGCGKQSDNQPGVVTAPVPAPVPATQVSTCTNNYNVPLTCNSGWVPFAGSCVPNGTLEQKCWYAGGMVGTVNGRQLCRVIKQPAGFLNGPIGLLTPRDPCGTQAMNVALTVKAGDLLNITASGGIGEPEVKTGEWWIFNYFYSSTSCNLTMNVDGISSETGQQVTNEGIKAGLVASDGVEVFFVGSRLANYTIRHDGQLKVGFNTAQPSFSACFDLDFEITLAHCEDVSGVTYPCQ